MPLLHASSRGWDSDRLTSSDANDGQIAERLRQRLSDGIRDAEGYEPDPEATHLRLLDASRANALRVPFLGTVFPQAIFVYVHRDPRESLAGMLEGWESGERVTHPELPGWEGPPWSYLLTPEWRALAGSSLAEVCLRQWTMSTRILLDDLERLAPQRWCVVDFAALRDHPSRELGRLGEFTGIEWSEGLAAPIDGPAPETWRRRESEAERVIDGTRELAQRAREWIAKPPQQRERSAVDPSSPEHSPLRSVNSANLVDILDQRRLGRQHRDRPDDRLPALRGSGRGDLRGDGAAGHPLPRARRARIRRGQPDLCRAGRSAGRDGLRRGSSTLPTVAGSGVASCIMLTVPEAARRVNRKPETVRRWIREGRLRARKIGTQHVIEEQDLEVAAPEPWPVEIPEALRYYADGTPQPDWEALIREGRDSR